MGNKEGIEVNLKKKIRELLKKMIYKELADSNSFSKKLKSLGAAIGHGTVFYDPKTNMIDTQNPYLLDIGENVRITKGVIILTHDYSWSVWAGVAGNCLGRVAPVKIGNNVFIGMNAVILCGTVIEDNVIIGAGSIVHGICEANSVYAGSPAKRISSLEEYARKREKNIVEEAKAICRIYFQKTGNRPGITQLREYQFLFKKDVDLDILMRDTGYYDLARRFLSFREPCFESMDMLIDEALFDGKKDEKSK